MPVKLHLFLYYLVIQLAFSSTASAFTQSGGKDAHPALFPGYVRIGLHNLPNSKLQCSAVKVAPRVYITAGHCIESPIFKKGQSLQFINLNDKEVKVVSTATAPSDVWANDPIIPGNRVKLDLAMFMIETEVPQIQAADLSLVYGKQQIQPNDRFRMVGKRDIANKSIYAYSDTQNIKVGPFCINTFNDLKQGSIQPGDSGGPLYLMRGDKAFLVGVTSAIVSNIRETRDYQGNIVRESSTIQSFTRIEKSCKSLADQWIANHLRSIQSNGVLQQDAPSPSNSDSRIYTNKAKQKISQRRY